MDEKAQVWPDFVDIIQVVSFDDLFHTELDPAGHTHDKADIPLRRQLNDLFQLPGPVRGAGDLPSGLVKGLKPERDFPGGDAAEVT